MDSPGPSSTRAFGGTARIAVSADDPAAAAWLDEFVTPSFAATSLPADWRLHLSTSAGVRADLHAPRFAADPRACFALDTSVLSLPVARGDGRLHVADVERSCLLHLAPHVVEVIGDPGTRRWRFTALLVLLEIAATHMRRGNLDLHAAGVAIGGRALAILGPKGAGKTTLSIYLLRAAAAAALANDRVFAGVRDDAIVVHGVPTAVKLRRSTVELFPPLVDRLPDIERPYLYALDELPRTAAAAATDDLALSPPQLRRQLAAPPCASAPLAAILVPRVRADLDGWSVARIEPDDLPAILRANLYGSAMADRAATLFEEMDGGLAPPSSSLIDQLAHRVPAYRVELGRGAYADTALAARLDAIARPA